MGDDSILEAPAPTAPDAPASAQLRTVVVCDLAGSTALVERLGDRRAAELFRRHDRLARDLLQRHHGREIDKTDGFLLLFDRPIHAVAFALDYQRALRDLGAGERLDLLARVGVHVGDVVVWENTARDIAQGAKRTEVEGLAKPVAARLMNLARPGQILLSGMTHNLAQRSQHELGPVRERVRWPTHGRFRFKGVPAPMLVHEVGEVGIAPLRPPPSSSKAQRELPLWRQPRVLAAEAIAALGTVLVLVFALTTRPQPAIAFGERDWVVVGDLRNLTGDASIEDALEAAFRVSLEQSRFVNVLPDLTLRAALARMEQPADAAVDRETGSEIALREGARALILPTVADIGGRIRVSAEIVDPQTQTTVYAEAADGVGLESSLQSMDQVAAQLRLSLGETLQLIGRDSQPLPKVTSGDLEALQAYAAAEQKLFDGDNAGAAALFAKALEIDPGFALAHVGAARADYATGAFSTAREHLSLAGRIEGRLTARDTLYVEAWSTTLAQPDAGLERWQLLTTLYPDYRAGHFNAAMFGWQYGNLYDEGLPFLQAALESKAGSPAPAHYLRGILHTGANRPREALSEFARAASLGLASEGLVLVGAHLTLGDVPAARRALDAMREPDGALASNQLLARIATEVHVGDFAAARDAARQGAASFDAGVVWARVLRAHEVQLAWAMGDRSAVGLAEALVDGGLRELAAGTADPVEVCASVLVTAHVMAQLPGTDDLVARAVAGCEPVVAAARFGMLLQLQQTVQAQQASSSGNAAAALTTLDAMTAQSPVLAHAVRMQVAAQAGRHELSHREATWLRANRGRAHAEFVFQWIALPAALAWTRAAALWEAEALLEEGRRADARALLAEAIQETPWIGAGPFAARFAALSARARSLEDVGDE